MLGQYFWILMIGALGLTMFLLVPPQKIIELLSFGLVFGFILGNVILYTGTTLLPLFSINNEIFSFPQWGLSIPIAWTFTTIIFAYFLPKIIDTRLGLYGYIAFWAGGTTIMYFILRYLNYWQDIRWNTFSNLVLATFTHSMMALFLYKTNYIKKYRATHAPQENLWDQLRSKE